MPTASKTMLALLVGCTFTLGCAVPTAALAKDHRKLCGASTTAKVQACGKQAVKVPPKKPATKGSKEISPGALLLLQLLL